MNDKELELVKQILGKAGSASEAGFKYLVQYKITDGVISMIGYGVLLTICFYLFRRLDKWKPADDYEGDKSIGKIFGMIVVLLFSIGFICGFFNSITELMAPQGAAIIELLNKS